MTVRTPSCCSALSNHLPEREARLQALREARRVARPGSPVVATGISRYATLMDIGSDGRLTEAVEPFLHRLHTTGQFRGDVVGFTTAYFHLPDELALDLADAGLCDVEVYGIEGPAGPTLRALGLECLDERLGAAVRAARMVERWGSADRRKRPPARGRARVRQQLTPTFRQSEPG